MSVDTKKVGDILKYIAGADYLYMKHCIEMRDAINRLIKRHDLTKEDFCQRFDIDESIYEDFIVGNYNYSVRDMAALNASFMDLEIEILKNRVPVHISD